MESSGLVKLCKFDASDMGSGIVKDSGSGSGAAMSEVKVEDTHGSRETEVSRSSLVVVIDLIVSEVEEVGVPEMVEVKGSEVVGVKVSEGEEVKESEVEEVKLSDGVDIDGFTLYWLLDEDEVWIIVFVEDLLGADINKFTCLG